VSGQELDEDGDRGPDENEPPGQLLVEKPRDEDGHEVRLWSGKVAVSDAVHAAEHRGAG
jgi:hypothetical protein